MRDLGTLNSDDSFSNDINASGKVAGLLQNNRSSDPDGFNGFVWDGTNMRDLNFDADTCFDPDGDAPAINVLGQVTGFTLTDSCEPRAFLWDGLRGA